MSELAKAGGRRFSDGEIAPLRAHFVLPDDFARCLREWELAGADLTLDKSSDKSGIGAAMQWMNGEEMVSEATEMYPGLLAKDRGYIPVAACMRGSGDPYFLRSRDGAIVRIPHDAVVAAALDEQQIELVATNVNELIAAASL